MPHFKCMACRTRLYSAGNPADSAARVCPGCGEQFEPVGTPAELVGFRSVTAPGGGAAGGAPGMSVGDITGLRQAIQAQARRDALDAGRWIDDGGSLRADAVAMPRPPTTS
jgi:hypothetical protein